MPVYSHSRLSTFENCPLKYKYGYIDGVKMKRRTIEAFMGSRFHEVMEHLYGRLAFEKPDLEKLKELFGEKWEREWGDDVEVIRGDRTAEDYRKIGIKALEDYFRRHEPFDEGHVLGIERNIFADLDGTGKYKLRCIMDRIMKRDDGRYEIHDYKTSSSLPTQLDADGDRQLALYEIALRQAWPEIEGVDLIWHYVAFDVELRSRRTREELADLSARTIGLIDSIESITDFEPHESNLCEWCDYQRICPLFAHRFKTDRFGSVDYEKDGGQSLVNSFAALDAQKHELATRVKQIEAEQEKVRRAAVDVAESEGVKRLFGDDHVLNIRDDIKVAYPKRGEIRRADFEKTMKGMGLWEEVSDISWSALKSLAERSGWSEGGTIPSDLTDLVKVDRIKQVRLARRKDKDLK